MSGHAAESRWEEHAVGVRDLSHRTSQILSRVKSGERLIVTDRGQPVAAVIPVRRSEMPLPATGYAPSGDPGWATRAAEELDGFGQ
jgi:prevent-host-death family protein